jgi:hypothetical protein
MELVHEFTFHASLGETLPIGSGPFGHRSVGYVGDGWAKGERINGRVVGPGADWVLVGNDGYAEIDVRAQLRTDDGVNLYMHYTGSIEMSDAVVAALFSGADTAFGDQYWYTHVRLESGADNYQWVNRTMFIGQGRVVADGVDYDVFRLA